MRCRAIFAAVLVGTSIGCERHAVDVELPTPQNGRSLSNEERKEVQRIADDAFRDVRSKLDGLPPRLALIVRWGKDVIPETGETGAAGYPGNVGWTIDPDRDVLATIRTQLRATLVHELHHLARASRVPTASLRDQVVSEGLATAFERDVTGTALPWAEAPPNGDSWACEILRQPPTADRTTWIYRHPDGRRWIGMRVGTLLVDRAVRASGKSPAALVFASTDEVVRLAAVECH